MTSVASLPLQTDYGIWLFVAPFSQSLWIAMVLIVFFVAQMLPSVLRDTRTARPLVGGGTSGLRAKMTSRLEMVYHAMGAFLVRLAPRDALAAARRLTYSPV